MKKKYLNFLVSVLKALKNIKSCKMNLLIVYDEISLIGLTPAKNPYSKKSSYFVEESILLMVST